MKKLRNRPFEKFLQKLFLVFIFLSSFYFAKAQDPGTSIDIRLSSDGKAITEKNFDDYSILFRKSWISKEDSLRNHKTPITYTSYGNYKNDFNIFYWEPYRNEILELTVIHLHDTMTIRIKDSIKNSWNAFFYFDIPYKKGYFEITKLVYRTGLKGSQGLDHGYTISDDYKWEAVTKEKRKLLMDD